MKKNSFVEGTFSATFAIFVSKIIGILYVIPFYSIIGSFGSSLYSYAYHIYVIFLDMSTAGIPTAISKIVSEYEAKEKYEAKKRSFRLAIIMISILSIICFLTIFIFAKQIAYLMIGDKIGGNNISDIVLVIRAISFSILIIPLLSVSRGYLQGHKYITAASVTQIIEQIVRVCVLLASSFITIKVLHKSVPLGIAIALTGSFFGGAAAIVYIINVLFKNKKIIENTEPKDNSISNKEILKKIFYYAIPFIIINLTVNLYNAVDMSLTIRTLGKLNFSGADAEFIASAATTWSYKLNMIVNAIATGLIISLIPNLVSAHVLKQKDKVNNVFNQALQISLLVSIPAAVGISLLAGPIWTVFYGYDAYGINVLRFNIISAIFCNLYLLCIQTAQSINSYKVVYISVLLGFITNALLDVPFMYLMNKLNIAPYYGPTLASICGYTLSVLIVLIYLHRKESISIKPTISVFFKILLSTAAMGVVVYLLQYFVHCSLDNRLLIILYLLLYVSIGAITYLFIIYKLNLINTVFGKSGFKQILKKFKKKTE